MTRGRKPTGLKYKTRTFRLDLETSELLDKLARDSKDYQASVLRKALRAYAGQAESTALKKIEEIRKIIG